MDKLRNYFESIFNVFCNEMDMALSCTLCAHFVEKQHKSFRGNGRQDDVYKMRKKTFLNATQRQDTLSCNFDNEMKTKTRTVSNKLLCQQIKLQKTLMMHNVQLVWIIFSCGYFRLHKRISFSCTGLCLFTISLRFLLPLLFCGLTYIKIILFMQQFRPRISIWYCSTVNCRLDFKGSFAHSLNEPLIWLGVSKKMYSASVVCR